MQCTKNNKTLCQNNFTICKDDLNDVFTIDNFFTESTNCTVWIIPRNSKKDLPFQTCKLDRDSELFSKKTFQCNEMERNLCMSFAAMTLSVDSEKVFYNPMCAKCLHGSGHQTTFEQCELAFYKKDDLGWFFTPYSVLISIRRGLTIVKLNKFSESRDIARCNKDNYFDFKKEKCVPIIEDLNLESQPIDKNVSPDSFLGCQDNCFEPVCFPKKSTILIEVNKNCEEAKNNLMLPPEFRAGFCNKASTQYVLSSFLTRDLIDLVHNRSTVIQYGEEKISIFPFTLSTKKKWDPMQHFPFGRKCATSHSNKNMPPCSCLRARSSMFERQKSNLLAFIIRR